MPDRSSNQNIHGNYNAQASHGGTAIVNVYQQARPQEVEPDRLARAERRLAELPLDEIPAPAALPPGSRLRLARNPLFVGREVDLRRLARALKAGETAAIGPVAAATGLGGIGKTQLAGEFAHRYGQYFSGGIFWLNFANPAGVPAEVALCGGRGHLELAPDFGALPLEDQVRLVLSAWQNSLPRLLIFDNCEDETLLAQWRPPSGGCRLLVTSRRGEWDPALGVQALPLGVLSRAESIELLLKFRPDLAADQAGLDALAKELGDLPLALHLAGSYLARYRRVISPAGYLAQLRDKALLKHPSLRGIQNALSPTGHDLDVFRTFALSFQKIDPASPADQMALRLLSRAACFAPGEPVPHRLLAAASLGQEEADEDAALQVEDGLARLVELGLIETEAGGALRLHRLLAAFVRLMPADAEAQDAVEKAVFAEASRLNRAGYPAPLLAWQAHLHHVTEAAQAREDEQGARLCTELGYYLHQAGDYASARPLYERALAIWEKMEEPEHPDTATSLNKLANLLHTQGDYAAAQPLYERALAIRKKTLGPEHPATVASLNDLALLFHQGQGDTAAARPLYERALAIYEKVLGPGHFYTATSLNNLAGLLYDQGDYIAARPMYERALAIKEKTLGPEHPNTALSLNNLARLLEAQGDTAAAQPLYERALTIREKTLGPEHPDTATSLNDLALLLKTQADYAAARPLFERALAILEARLGPDHPRTRIVRGNLAGLEH